MLEIIEEIAGASGRKKEDLLAKHPELTKTLIYAYNPFKKYYMTPPDLEGTPGAPSNMEAAFYILDQLINRSITGREAFEKVCDTMVSLPPDEAEVMRRIIQKDLRAGISTKTINKVWPNLINLSFCGSEKPDFMLVKGFDTKMATFPLLGAVKKDGIRARYLDGYFISRSGRPFTGLTHLEKALKKYFEEYEWDGELFNPVSAGFDEGSGDIRSDAESPNAIYYIFDMPSVEGNKLKRYNALKSVLPKDGPIQYIQHYLLKDQADLMKFYKWALKNGEEGIVVYDPNSDYGDRRCYDWMRVVPVRTADCKVVGFYEGRKGTKLENSLGGIVVEFDGQEVKVGSGFKEKPQLNQGVSSSENISATGNNSNSLIPIPSHIDPTQQNVRKYIWDNKEYFIGKIAQCEYKEKTKKGSMRQPRFIKWRWDKS